MIYSIVANVCNPLKTHPVIRKNYHYPFQKPRRRCERTARFSSLHRPTQLSPPAQSILSIFLLAHSSWPKPKESSYHTTTSFQLSSLRTNLIQIIYFPLKLNGNKSSINQFVIPNIIELIINSNSLIHSIISRNSFVFPFIYSFKNIPPNINT